MLAGLLAVGLSSPAVQEAVLWWRVDDPSGIEVQLPHNRMTTAAELGVTDARIRVVDTDEYLMMAPFDDGEASSPATGVPMEWYASVVSPYNSEAYSFAIELGNYDYMTGNWTALASSEVVSYTYLRDMGHIVKNWDGVYPEASAVWAPASYSAPEPSSGLLLLVGGGLLALRRKRGVQG